MNVGRDYKKARAHAQANADRSGEPWVLIIYGDVYWAQRLSTYSPHRQKEILSGIDHQAKLVRPRHSGTVTSRHRRHSADRTHLPRTGIPLTEYEHAVRKACQWLKVRTALRKPDERELILDGYAHNRKPITVALRIERLRRARRKGRR